MDEATNETPAEKCMAALDRVRKDCYHVETVTIKVYLQDGRVVKYDVKDGPKAREHAHRIVTKGWRNATNGVMEYYPVHQVLKVTFKDPRDELSKKYEARGA